MSTLSLLDAIERPSILGLDRGEREPVRQERAGDRGDRHAGGPTPVGGTPTLDDLLTGTWEALALARPAACPMCSGPLEPRYGAGPTPVAARCMRCATELS
jgi:hypothetical protein